MALNLVVMMGRLAYNPELKVTDSGIEWLKFKIAVDRNYKKKSEEKQADFFSCVAWRQTAVFIDKYFKKGSMIAIKGSLITGTYTDNEGMTRATVEIDVDEASFCGGKAENSAPSNMAPATVSDTNYDIDDDSLPF